MGISKSLLFEFSVSKTVFDMIEYAIILFIFKKYMGNYDLRFFTRKKNPAVFAYI